MPPTMPPTSALHSPAIDEALDAVAGRLRQSTATVRVAASRRTAPIGQGAAVVWSADGLLLTNAHVAHGADVLIDLPDERRLPARVVARDARHDLAALRVDPGAIPLVPALRADATELRPGQLVLAFGHPLGVSNSLSMGVLHGIRSPYVRQPSVREAPPLLCADIRLAPGNSGGPMADAAGRVIGINTLIARGLGFAIPTDRASRFVDSLAPRPRLGLTVRSVSVRGRGDATAAPALLVLEVASGLPAEAAGFLPGDVLFAFDGHPLTAPSDLAAALAAASGAAHELTLGRGGRRMTRILPASAFGSHASRAA
jgi:serine protease Do